MAVALAFGHAPETQTHRRYSTNRSSVAQDVCMNVVNETALEDVLGDGDGDGDYGLQSFAWW